MIKLSLCMIVKNEEDVLARCLDCVADIADEIILVDTGSTDRTKEIASYYTDNCYNFKWIDDFSAARNFAFSKAEKDYIFWLDADDILTEGNREALKRLKRELDPTVDMIMMKYHVAFDSDHNPTFSYFRERIFKRSNNYQWIGAIHEVIVPSGNILYSDIAVTHNKLNPSDPNRNLHIFEKMIAGGKELEPREEYYYARELYYHKRYDKAIGLLIKFLDDGKGWIENNISACEDLAACYFEKGDEQSGLHALYRSFDYDRPRAEICCNIGEYCLRKEQYERAVFWYQIAVSCKVDENAGGFIKTDCYGYLPHIQLCVCYDRMGKQELARKHNDLAGAYKPNDPFYLQNREYFEKLSLQNHESPFMIV